MNVNADLRVFGGGVSKRSGENMDLVVGREW